MDSKLQDSKGLVMVTKTQLLLFEMWVGGGTQDNQRMGQEKSKAVIF